MKRILLTAVALVLGATCLRAQSSDDASSETTVWRNQMLIAPFYFFDHTFMISYERIFPANGALRISPSVTLSNVDNNKEGFGVDLGYKAFLLDKNKVRVYFGPYAMFKQMKHNYAYYDYGIGTRRFRESYQVLGLGVDSGIKLTLGRFVLDATIGGGIRYPSFQEDKERDASSVFDDTYKGIIPRINVCIGVAL